MTKGEAREKQDYILILATLIPKQVLINFASSILNFGKFLPCASGYVCELTGTPGTFCLNVDEREIGGTTDLKLHWSGSCPTWMASVPKDGKGVNVCSEAILFNVTHTREEGRQYQGLNERSWVLKLFNYTQVNMEGFWDRNDACIRTITAATHLQIPPPLHESKWVWSGHETTQKLTLTLALTFSHDVGQQMMKRRYTQGENM